MGQTYLVRQIYPKVYEVAMFEDSSESVAVYKVTHPNFACNCRGYHIQKDKQQHKHSKLVKYWINHLNKGEGIALWIDNGEIKYNEFLDRQAMLRLY